MKSNVWFPSKVMRVPLTGKQLAGVNNKIDACVIGKEI
jgi:hypothetical protein